jgi:Acetyltransferase (GNAT) domain
VPVVVRAEGSLLERALNVTHLASPQGLSRRAATTVDAALSKTAWAPDHRRRYVLVEGADVLACAQRYELSGTFAGQAVRICGIGGVCSDPAHGNPGHARVLVEHLVDDARRNGSDIAIVFASSGSTLPALDGFAVIPTHDVEVTVTESSRYGAPMTLVRGGEDRDLAAIVAMGDARAARYRFHLTRDGDFVKYAVTKKRLLAGLACSGARQLLFVIAEEGITAAAYAVISIVDGRWTIEECGDRDPSGARVGAILQALIAREPAERRPVIRGWLPPGFVPPQVTIVSAQSSEETLLARPLTPSVQTSGLSCDDVLYWRSDVL